MLQLSSVAGGQQASVVMAAKPSGKFDTSIANLWTHCASHDRNEFIELSSNLKKKKKKEKLLSSKKYYKQHSRWSFFPLSLIIYDPPPHTCAKRAHAFETRRAFLLSRKKILRTALETDRYPRNAAERHAIFNGGNVEFENRCSNDSSHGWNG